MSKIDIAQLIKILNLTQSDNDNEALTALRIAQSHMKKAGVDWTKLLNKTPEPIKKSRFKPMPTVFDFGWFKAAVESEEFQLFLSDNHREWVNGIVRYANANRYIPNKHWTDFVQLWDTFRESRG